MIRRISPLCPLFAVGLWLSGGEKWLAPFGIGCALFPRSKTMAILSWVILSCLHVEEDGVSKLSDVCLQSSLRTLLGFLLCTSDRKKNGGAYGPNRYK